MFVVRSVRTFTCTDAGRLAWSWGSRLLMLLTTLMVFAPGWRWMLTMIAGTSSIHAACLLFSTPLTIVATSSSRTGEPLRYATTTRR
jgi:hypothetical protein